uniref:Rad21_Rec8 domain-containing protein n=1 Tax=Ascaris lumbricoides TaxID=6252 RepID=A0A0M3IWN6_ASCLU
MPSCLLKRKMRGSFTHHTPFTIEKVSLYAVKVRWLTTPSASVTPPPERITKPDVDRIATFMCLMRVLYMASSRVENQTKYAFFSIIKLDTLEYTQAVCGDRMKLKPDDSVTVVRKAEWEKVLAKELMEKLPDEADDVGRRNRQAAAARAAAVPAPMRPLIRHPPRRECPLLHTNQLTFRVWRFMRGGFHESCHKWGLCHRVFHVFLLQLWQGK